MSVFAALMRDVVQAFSLSLREKFAQFGAFNISAAPPFIERDCDRLRVAPVEVLRLPVPKLLQAFARRNWLLPERIDRVYVIDKAKSLLAYQPRFGFQELLSELDLVQAINVRR